MRRLLSIGVVATTLSISAGEGAAEDRGSKEWNTLRANVFVETCLATAPSFAGFPDAATIAGLRKGADGRYSYGSTEIVASSKPQECSCLVTFYSENRFLLLDAFFHAVRTRYGERYEVRGGGILGTLLLDGVRVDVDTVISPRDLTRGLLATAEGACL